MSSISIIIIIIIWYDDVQGLGDVTDCLAQGFELVTRGIL
jgi:hypothetical protein